MLKYPFLFRAPAAAAVCTLSLHDALPIWHLHGRVRRRRDGALDLVGRIGVGNPDGGAGLGVISLGAGIGGRGGVGGGLPLQDRKSTRLNSSHITTSYAVFCSKRDSRGRAR